VIGQQWNPRLEAKESAVPLAVSVRVSLLSVGVRVLPLMPAKAHEALVQDVPYDSGELSRRERFPNEPAAPFDDALLFEDVVGVA